MLRGAIKVGFGANLGFDTHDGNDGSRRKPEAPDLAAELPLSAEGSHSLYGNKCVTSSEPDSRPKQLA